MDSTMPTHVHKHQGQTVVRYGLVFPELTSEELVHEAVTSVKEGAQCEFNILPLVRQASKASSTSPELTPVNSSPFFQLDDLLVSDVRMFLAPMGIRGHSSQIVGKCSPFLSLDLSDLLVREEAAWSTHIGNYALLMDLPATPGDNLRLARVVSSLLHSREHTTPTWVAVSATNQGWERWNEFRTLCNFHPELHVFLITPPCGDILTPWDKFAAEPVEALCVSVDCFLSNKSKYPALVKEHQEFIQTIMKQHSPIVFLSDAFTSTLQNTSSLGDGVISYISYLKHLQSKIPQQDFFTNECILQEPLQPLTHNLQSTVYETFESDNPKYDQYESAIHHALLSFQEDMIVKVVVAGAGRGPLVDRVRQAAERSKREVIVWAIEKNPCCVVTLQKRSRVHWQGHVRIVNDDMRNLTKGQFVLPNETLESSGVDVIVSELLGSFGDNELSPECLDGAQHILKPNGIIIPYSYTSTIAPFSSHVAWNQTRQSVGTEQPYVIQCQKGYNTHPTKALWTFTHPTRSRGTFSSNLHNSRVSTVTFHYKHSALIHGFMGCFHCILYKCESCPTTTSSTSMHDIDVEVTLSIDPSTHTADMQSWYPIFFPLQQPLCVHEGETLEVTFWRCCDEVSVWYEWCVIVVSDKDQRRTPYGICNAGGKWRMGLR